MNVQELIDELEKVEDKSLAVCVQVSGPEGDLYKEEIASIYRGCGRYDDSACHTVKGRYICME